MCVTCDAEDTGADDVEQLGLQTAVQQTAADLQHSTEDLWLSDDCDSGS